MLLLFCSQQVPWFKGVPEDDNATKMFVSDMKWFPIFYSVLIFVVCVVFDIVVVVDDDDDDDKDEVVVVWMGSHVHVCCLVCGKIRGGSGCQSS